MTTIFDTLLTAFAGVLGIDTVSAGWLLGFVVIIVALVALTWALGDALQGNGFLIPVGVGIAFVAIVGWWPPWSIIFIGIIVLFALFGPFSNQSAGGM